MQQMFMKLLAIALLMSSACYGQSLGDLARANRERTAEDSAVAPPMVITTADFPPNAHTNPAPRDPPAQKRSEAADHRSAQQRLAEQRAREQWKRQIVAQKANVDNLQARITQLHASIQSANGSAQFEGPSSRYQARQLQQVGQIQHQLEVQRIKLEQMQDAARHAGMHTAVYDP
jgi:predicted RNase H-like nuclease (RuvC/YqgF family)